ncbi:hypothetical protein Leryth_015712 [Lithospermum erythrorhizon]|nr:hypothetical protein Leryth_015712 [Lithospermum erythrorhizon]
MPLGLSVPTLMFSLLEYSNTMLMSEMPGDTRIMLWSFGIRSPIKRALFGDDATRSSETTLSQDNVP